MNHRPLMSIASFVLTLVAASVALPAAAQKDYPSKPVRLIVPYPPGGPTDIIGRLASEVLAKQLDQSIVVDNRGGAATVIGAEMAARANPDGYTLLVSSETTFAVNPAIRPKLAYDAVRDFAPVSMLTTQPYVLAVTPSLPATSVTELIAFAKSNPGKLSFGSAGQGGANHLAGEMFKHAAKIDILHVPYKGNGPAIIDLIGGQIGLMLGSISSLYPHAAAKKLRLLAIASAKRSPSAPELPTFSESGMPGFQVSGWNCIVAPRGTSTELIRRLNAAVNNGFKQPDVLDRLRKQSIELAAGTPEALAQHMKTEIARYGKLIKAVGLKVD